MRKFETLKADNLSDAANLFLSNYEVLRGSVPILPDKIQKTSSLAASLERMIQKNGGIAVIEGGKLVGYLTWMILDDLRNTGRKGAYCPEWAHAVLGERGKEIYLSLYKEAVKVWDTAGCKSHAFTYLVSDHNAEDFLYWNGFGLICVDSIRPIQRVENTLQSKYEIRKATQADAEQIAGLSQELWDHMTQPPIFMLANQPEKEEDIEAFLHNPKNSYWLADVNGEAAAYFRVEGDQAGNTFTVKSDTTAAITSAYTQPQHRGLGLASAMLNAIMQDYGSKGYERCSVDYESINPEASAYWRKHFTPVCYSAIRHPESFLKAD